MLIMRLRDDSLKARMEVKDALYAPEGQGQCNFQACALGVSYA
jgi:hypothetical protein